MTDQPAYKDMTTMTLMLTAYNRMAREVFRALKDAGFDDQRPAHGNVMEQLHYRDRQRLKDLADGAGVTPQSIGQLVDELEALGYVERKSDPTDRRAKLIILTSKGRRVVRAATVATAKLDRHLKRILGPKGFSALRGTLEAILSARIGPLSTA
jgi:DNA-binding MarR family transcriptional regulator